MAFKKPFSISLPLFGAVGSPGLMLYTGRHNNSVLLHLLFTTWILSPFIALLLANMASKRLAVLTRMPLYSLVLAITIGSLVSYSVVLISPGATLAFIFLVIPLVSWLLMMIVIFIPQKKIMKQQKPTPILSTKNLQVNIDFL